MAKGRQADGSDRVTLVIDGADMMRERAWVAGTVFTRKTNDSGLGQRTAGLRMGANA